MKLIIKLFLVAGILLISPKLLSQNLTPYKESYPDGSVKRIGFLNDNNKPHGEWKYYTDKGKLLQVGKWNNGIKEGEWKYYRFDKLYFKGNFENGKKTGTWYYFDEDFGDKTIEYKFGLLDGTTIIYYNNSKYNYEYDLAGKIKSKLLFHKGSCTEIISYSYNETDNYLYGIVLENTEGYYMVSSVEKVFDSNDFDPIDYDIINKMNGVCKYYNKDNTLLATGNMVNGEMQGKWIGYYKNGKTQWEGEYNNSLQHGKWINYHLNGTKAAERIFTNGKTIGEYRMFYDNGKIYIKFNQILNSDNKSVVIGSSYEYYKNGNLRREENYKFFNNELETNISYILEYNENGEKVKEIKRNEKGELEQIFKK